MESDDDFQFFDHGEDEPSSPIQQKRLKRLKRAISDANEATARIADPEPPNAFHSNSDAPLESPDIPDLEESVDPFQPLFVYEGFDDKDDSGKDREGMVSDGARLGNEGDLLEEGQDRVDRLDVGIGGSDGIGNDLMSDLGGRIGDFADVSDSGDKEEKKNKRTKKKKGKSGGDDGKPEASAGAKRRLEKERKNCLRSLHVETQRLLRETRDASFKPVPLVHKPISSVLEKIRKRKLEISKKTGTLSNFSEIDGFSRETAANMCTEHVEINEATADDMGRNLDFAEEDDHLGGASGRLGERAFPSDECENDSSDLPSKEECKSTFRKPIDDTQDISCDSESDNEDDAQPDSPLEEEFAPSVLTMNLKLDSAPPEEISSEEEGDDKENIDPQPHKTGDPVKAFVDDEAEEEDDSDNDPMVQDNDEDEDNDDSEEFNDLIVSAYKEKPIDNEKRDELHQKWLEQQDAAATDNVLQRIKCGLQQGEPMAFDEIDEEEESEDESVDGVSVDPLPNSTARLNSKKVKQMIPQMFSDKDDGFVSDDEEAEKNLVRQRLLEKAEEQGTFLSPGEDESSREVFGLIKKLNIVPDTKKKAKSSSYLDKLITGTNSNSSSKSSFLGRVSSNSLPASSKHGSSNFRSFIFGRDDSNSRSSVSEASPDVLPDEKGNQLKKNPTAKFSNSQSKANTQSKVASETSSGSSLLEILRRASMKFDSKQTGIVGQTQSVIQFAAFKSRKSSTKMGSRT